MSRKLPKVLSEDEKRRFLDQFNTRYKTPHRNLCLVRIMLEAGLRVSEAVSLKDEHVDLESGQVIVREGKGAKDREVWISNELCSLIQKWVERKPKSEFIFPTSKGTKIKTRYMRAMVKRMARKANVTEVEKFSCHNCRHTFATDLLRQTNNLELVRKALGHSDVSSTQRYTHLVNDDLKKVMRR